MQGGDPAVAEKEKEENMQSIMREEEKRPLFLQDRVQSQIAPHCVSFSLLRYEEAGPNGGEVGCQGLCRWPVRSETNLNHQIIFSRRCDAAISTLTRQSSAR